jgi:cell division protein FtsI (penicillin-binding protein 3)
MASHPRLTNNREKRGRRIVLCCSLLGFFLLTGWLLDRHYGLVAIFNQGLTDFKSTFSPVEPVRGVLYDRNLRQLAVNLPRVSVYLRGREIESIPATLLELAEILDLDRAQLQEQLASGVLRLWVARGISEEQEAAITRLGLKGVYLQREEKRYYPGETQAAHLIGYAEDGIGLAGLEYHHDRLLADQKHRQQQAHEPLSPALDLVLTVDLKVQAVLEELLYDIAGLTGVQRVAAYIIEEQSGELIAGGQLPNFNPNSFAQYRQEILENMFFLPILLPDRFRLFIRDAAALQAQVLKNRPIVVWPISPDEEDLGSQLRLWDWLGLGEIPETDFHVTSPSGAIMSSPQRRAAMSKQSFGLVPEITTPLGLLNALALLHGDGRKIKPFAIKKILDAQTGKEILLDGQDTQAGQQLDGASQALPELAQLYYSQAERGASRTRYFHDSHTVIEPQGAYDRRLLQDLLHAILPAGAHDLHLLVMVERWPEGVEQGDREFNRELLPLLERRAERLSVLQQISKSVADYVEPGVVEGGNYLEEVAPGAPVPQSAAAGVDKEPIQGVMPDLTGLSLRKSLRLLHSLHMDITFSGTGWVVDQRPPPGTEVQSGDSCHLLLEKRENLELEKVSKRPVD